MAVMLSARGIVAGSLVGLNLDRPECNEGTPPDSCCRYGSGLGGHLSFQLDDDDYEILTAIFYRPRLRREYRAALSSDAPDYLSAARQAVTECYSDGPLPLKSSATAQCIWDSFDDSELWKPPRVVVVFLISTDSEERYGALKSTTGGVMAVYDANTRYTLSLPGADGRVSRFELSVYLMVPKELRKDQEG